MKNSHQGDDPKVHWVEITEANMGQRLDNFLLSYLKGVPKTRIYRIVRKGEVRVNKKRSEAKYRLNTGDVIRIPPVRTANSSEQTFIHPSLKTKLESNILFEDEALLILNKPSGFAVHGGSGINSGIIEGLRLIRPKDRFLELVHRLDKDTSGCLIIAKKNSALRIMHDYFRGDGIEKTYLALFSGRWSRKKITVDAPLQKNISKGGERIVVVSKSGKPAETFFRRISLLQHSTLVEAFPKTGRTHQIRVHAAWLGHPILGDERYGEAESNRKIKQRGLKRLFLHAQKLVFKHPVSGVRLSIEAPLPLELENFLANER